MYEINNQSHNIMSSEKIDSTEYYGGGRNAIREYLPFSIIVFKH